MALVLADRVRETTSSSGTGSVTLGGAVSGFKAFGSVLSTNDTTYYAIIANSGEWEVGVGTFTSPNSLARTTVLSSSNSGSLVSFQSGTKNVIITQPSEKAVFLDISGNAVSSNGGLSLSAPTITGGTLSSPTISTPTVSGGTFSSPTITTPLVTGGTFNSPTVVSPSITGTGNATFATITANASTTASSNLGAFNYGTLGFSDTGIVQSAQTSVNSYFQSAIQNTSSGTASSAEFIAYNDAGTASTNYAAFGINSSGYTGTGSISTAGYGFFVTASTDLVLGTIGNNKIHFTVNSGATDAMLIDTTGAVGVGATTFTGYTFRVSKNITGATTANAVASDGVVQSDVTAAAYGYRSSISTAAASFTLTSLQHYRAAQGTIGAGSTVTNQYGFFADSTLTGATNNYGFYGNVAAATGAYNFYSAGTAPNYSAGGIEQANSIASNYTVSANSNAQWITPLSISAIITVPSTGSLTFI